MYLQRTQPEEDKEALSQSFGVNGIRLQPGASNDLEPYFHALRSYVKVKSDNQLETTIRSIDQR